MHTYTLTYTVTEEANEFEFWGGARERMDNATFEQREHVYARLADVSLSAGLTKTDINDYVWFECDDIFDGEDEDEDE